MAAEIPGMSGAYVTRVTGGLLAEARPLSHPRLIGMLRYSHTTGNMAGNHGFYKFNSEIPRLARRIRSQRVLACKRRTDR